MSQSSLYHSCVMKALLIQEKSLKECIVNKLVVTNKMQNKTMCLRYEKDIIFLTNKLDELYKLTPPQNN
jgi:hypothetical protein